MSQTPYYKHFVGDYQQKTRHLSMLEHGAYRLLLDHYYSTKTPLPNDPTKLFRICGARTPSERKAVLSTTTEFFIEDGTLLRHERCDSEIAKLLKKSETNKANAKGTPPESPSQSGSEAPSTHARTIAIAREESNNPTSAATTAATPFQVVFDLGVSLIPHLAAKDTAPIRQWLTAGCDPEADILPTIRRLAPKNPNAWGYFTRAVMETKATREQPPPQGTPKARPAAPKSVEENVNEMVERFRAKGTLEE